MEENAVAAKATKSKSKKAIVLTIVFLLLVVIILASVLIYKNQQSKVPVNAPKMFVTTELEEVIQLSELNTYHGIYNGIARKYNPKKPEKIDYYVTYESEVQSCVDFEKIQIHQEENEGVKSIVISVPNPVIQEPRVVFESMDFIFENKKANTETVSLEAYQLCINDAKDKCKNEEEIFELAKENAEDTIHALVDPLIAQSYEGYTVLIRWEAE